MAVEKSEVEIKELISELNDLRFKITDRSPETIPSTKVEALDVQMDVISTLRDMKTDEEDLNYLKRAFTETRNLLAQISEALAGRNYKKGIQELISRLDSKYCNVQLFLSELEIPKRSSGRVSVG